MDSLFINPSPSRVWYSKTMKEDIPVVDCDLCWNPYWEDQLTDGLCPTCGENDLESFFEE